MEIAGKKMITSAKKCGADTVKFQKMWFSLLTECIRSKKAWGQHRDTNEEQYDEINNYCKTPDGCIYEI